MLFLFRPVFLFAEPWLWMTIPGRVLAYCKPLPKPLNSAERTVGRQVYLMISVYLITDMCHLNELYFRKTKSLHALSYKSRILHLCVKVSSNPPSHYVTFNRTRKVNYLLPNLTITPLDYRQANNCISNLES